MAIQKSEPNPSVGIRYECLMPAGMILEDVLTLRTEMEQQAANLCLPAGGLSYSGTFVYMKDGSKRAVSPCPELEERAALIYGYRFRGSDLLGLELGLEPNSREASELWNSGQRPTGWPEVWHEMVAGSLVDLLPEANREIFWPEEVQ